MQKQTTRESNLVKFVRFGIYLTAIVPLIIFKDFISPFHFGKVIVFRSLIEVVGVLYLILVLKDRSYLPRPDKIFWAFLLFTAAFTLTTVTSVLPYPSFWGSLARMGGLWTFWHYFLFYIILTSVLTKKEHWFRMLDITIIAGILSAFYGFGQKTDISFFVGSGGRARIFGTIGNAALFAGTQLLVVFLSLTLYFSPQNTKNRKIFYLFAFAITSIAVLMTAVRGSLLAYAVGMMVFLFLFGTYNRSRFGRMVFSGLVGLVIIFIVFSFLFKDSQFVKSSGYLSRITDMSLRSPTTETRFWAWEAGFKGWVDNPKTILLGWGPENFNIPFSKNFNPKFFIGSGSETLFDRAHNMFIETLVTMGLVGLLAYIGIFIVAFSYLRQFLKNNDLIIYGTGFVAAIVAYMIHNSFIFDTSANFVIFFTILGFVSYLKSGHNRTLLSAQTTKINKTSINVLGVVFLVFALFLIYKTNILAAKANYATTRAIVRSWAGDFNGAVKKYEEALSYDVPGKYEYRHRFAQYLVGPGGPSVKEEPVLEAYKHALLVIEKNIEENPIDYLPYLYASRLNIILGKDDPESLFNDMALEYSLKALKLSPKFVRTYYEIAQAYLNKKDYPKAVEYFQRAADLNPDAGVSYAYLGAAKIENGDLVGGAEDLKRAIENKNPYTPREVDFQKLINAYLAVNDHEKIAWVFEQLIVADPNNAQYRASLATTYANLGRIDDAVAVAHKAVEIDQTFESDARIFVQSLGREW